MLEKLKKILEQKSIDILSPIQGNAVPISQVNDPAFKKGLLGEGVAIIPSGGRVVAPFDGVVTQIFGTGHAMRMTSDDGIEILIHVGLETIQLQGRNFFLSVAEMQRVRRGDVLMLFDRDKIECEGFDVISPVIVCKTGKFSNLEPIYGMVDELSSIIRLRLAESRERILLTGKRRIRSTRAARRTHCRPGLRVFV